MPTFWQPRRPATDPSPTETIKLPTPRVGTKSESDRLENLAKATSKVLLKSTAYMPPTEAAQYIITCARNVELEPRELMKRLKLKKLPAEYKVRLAAKLASILAEEEANRL
jgi:hypothetical protein